MTKSPFINNLCAGMALILALGLSACSQQEATHDDSQAAAGKMPITTSSQEALAAYHAGLVHQDALRAVDANVEFQKAILADPGFAMGHLMEAITSQSAETFFAGVANAEAAMSAASEGEQLFIKAWLAAANNDTAAQGEALYALVALHPQDERAHFAMGNYRNGQQDFAGAIAAYDAAIAANPDFAPAYNSAGYTHRARDHLDEAKQSFEQYVQVLPNEANPLDSYAELLMEMGDYDGAIENYEKALSVNKSFPSAYVGVSLSAALKGDFDLAHTAAERGIEAARNFGERQGAMGSSVTAYLLAGDNERAMEMCEQMIEDAQIEGNNAALGGIHEYMGDALMVAGNVEAARPHIDLALDHRMQANTNEATKAAAERAHMFKMAIAAMVEGDLETSADIAAEYTAAAEADGNLFEKQRAKEIAGYLAMGDDPASAASLLGEANQFDPIVLYWKAFAEKEAGDSAKALETAKRAAYRNTLSGNLPFFRAQALQLIEELSSAEG